MLRRGYGTARNLLRSRRGLPRHARAGRVPQRRCARGTTSTARGASRAPGRRSAVRRRGDPGLEPRPLRRRLGRDLVARRVRRARALAGLPGDLPRGGGARRGTAARRRDRARDGRADDHQPRHRGAEEPLPEAAARRRRDLVPGLLGAGRGLRPRGCASLGAAGRRPLRARRTEGLVVVRPHRRLLHPPRTVRPRLGAARGADLPDRRHARPRRRGASAPPDHRRGRVQRDLPERGRGAARERDRRGGPRLGRGDDDAAARARDARLCARRATRGPGPEARGARRRPRCDRHAARGGCPRVDPPAGAPLDGVPVAQRARAHRHARARGLDPEARVVGGEPARHQARPRAARPRRAAPAGNAPYDG